MADHSHLNITIPITILSFIISIITTLIAIFLLHHFIITSNKRVTHPIKKSKSVIIHSTPGHDNAKSQEIFVQNNSLPKQQETAKILIHFKISASITVVFNALNSIFNLIYCFYLISDPCYDDNNYYIQHPSHIQHIAATTSWYIAKVSLIWLFSGRLYYAFKGSLLRLNGQLILSINIINTIFAHISVILGFWAVYNHNLILAEICFNSWRIQYQILTFIILYMFSKRLLLLTIKERSSRTILQTGINHKIESRRSTTNNIETIQAGTSRVNFLMIVTRNSVLVLTISVTVALVIFCSFDFRFMFPTHTRLTLLLPMIMSCIDSLITSICIICLFHIGNKLYYSLCKFCDNKCYKLSIYFGQKLLHVNTAVADESKSQITPDQINMQMQMELEQTNDKVKDINDGIDENKNKLELEHSNSKPPPIKLIQKLSLRRTLSAKKKSLEYSEILMNARSPNAKQEINTSNVEVVDDHINTNSNRFPDTNAGLQLKVSQSEPVRKHKGTHHNQKQKRSALTPIPSTLSSKKTNQLVFDEMLYL